MISAKNMASLIAAAQEMISAADHYILTDTADAREALDEASDVLQAAVHSAMFSECPGCREELGGKLICQCHPEAEATHGRDEETHS